MFCSASNYLLGCFVTWLVARFVAGFLARLVALGAFGTFVALLHHFEFAFDSCLLVLDAEVVEVSPFLAHLGAFGFHLFAHLGFAARFAFFHVAFAIFHALARAVLADAFAVFAAALDAFGAA